MAKAYVIPDLLTLATAAQAYPEGVVGFQDSFRLFCTKCIADNPAVLQSIQRDMSYRTRQGMQATLLLYPTRRDALYADPRGFATAPPCFVCGQPKGGSYEKTPS